MKFFDNSFFLENLTPANAHLCLKVAKFAEEQLLSSLSCKKVVVAFSGGADSLALLIICCALSKKYNLKISAAHLNHNLRSESLEDASWCKEFCKLNSIPFLYKSVDVESFAKENKKSIEHAARILRYEFLLECKESSNSDLILTGHNLNDLAEDVCIRLIRGVGWPSVSGMSAFVKDKSLLRPILFLSRLEIENFLSSFKINWLIDKSNNDHSYLRNRVRHKILPLMIEENPSFLKSISSLWELGKIDKDYFDKIICHKLLKLEEQNSNLESTKEFYVPKNIYSDLPKSLRLRLFKRCVEKLGYGQPLADNLFQLDLVWQGHKFPKTIQFPGNKYVKIDNKGMLWWADS